MPVHYELHDRSQTTIELRWNFYHRSIGGSRSGTCDLCTGVLVYVGGVSEWPVTGRLNFKKLASSLMKPFREDACWWGTWCLSVWCRSIHSMYHHEVHGMNRRQNMARTLSEHIQDTVLTRKNINQTSTRTSRRTSSNHIQAILRTRRDRVVLTKWRRSGQIETFPSGKMLFFNCWDTHAGGWRAVWRVFRLSNWSLKFLSPKFYLSCELAYLGDQFDGLKRKFLIGDDII